MALSDWDKRLLEQHLTRYKSLASGKSEPTSSREISFVNFIKNKSLPRTQHEIAYSRYLQINKNNKSELIIFKSKNDTKQNQMFEKNIDYIDEQISLNQNVNKEDKKISQKITSWYKKNFSHIQNIKIAEALAWLNQITSESAISKSLERLSAESLNTLSNVYTKALDGDFSKFGLQSGENHISPWFHRIDLEGHTLIDALQKVRDALPNDTKWEEYKGLITSLASDMSSVIGLPIATIGKETRENISDILNHVGISDQKFADLWSQNTVELVGSVIPAISLLLSWNEKDTYNFTKIVGMIKVTSLYSGNPISVIISIVGLARSYHLMKKNKQSTKSWVLAFSKGGAISALSIIAMSLLGPVIWTTLITIFIIYILNKKSFKIDVSNLCRKIKDFITKENNVSSYAKN